MAGEALPVERLRAYLAGLPAGAQAALVATLERALLRGEYIPAADFILNGLRPAIPAMVPRPPRIPNPSRLFFAPLEPFLTSSRLPALPLGYVSRAALAPLWNWIRRDLIPAPARVYRAQANEALLAGDAARAAQLARNFQDYAAQAMSNLLERVDVDDKSRRRAAAQVGTPRGLTDVREVLAILRNRDLLADFSAALPDRIANLAGAQAEQMLLRLLTTTHANPGMLPFMLVLLKARLQTGTHLVRLAVLAASSDVAARVAQAPMAAAVALVLGELRMIADDLRSALKKNRVADAVMLLRRLRDDIRGLRTEMDMTRDSAWGRELCDLRGGVAAELERQIRPMPAVVRRLLRPPQGRDAFPGTGPNEHDVADAEARLALVVAARSFADELAVNQTAREVHLELQHFIERGVPLLLDGLRMAGSQDQQYRRAQADAAVRFAAKVFGSEYADNLRRAVAAAAAPAPPRKAAGG